MKLTFAILITISVISCKYYCIEKNFFIDNAIINYTVMPEDIDSTKPPLILEINITKEIQCLLKQTTDTFTYNVYILILGLKLYEYQYYFFHQGYRLEVNLLPFLTNKITSELIRITKSKDDYLTPRIAYEFVKNNSAYLSNKQIKELMDRIDDIEESINNYKQY
jgi:hypothetical protein